MEWHVKAIRGATTASENTEEAIAAAVTELLQELEYRNRLDPDRIVSVIFTATKDLDAVFPAAIARRNIDRFRPSSEQVRAITVENTGILITSSTLSIFCWRQHRH